MKNVTWEFGDESLLLFVTYEKDTVCVTLHEVYVTE